MQRKNMMTLAIIWVASAMLMVVVRLISFPDKSPYAIGGLGLVAITLMFLNRRWLHPASPPMPRLAIIRSALAAATVAIALVLLFGSLG